mgnify:CR=1 FL=1
MPCPIHAASHPPRASALVFARDEYLGGRSLITALPTMLALLAQPSAPPSPEDTQETVDVRFTPAVRALAARLDNDPVAIFNYVSNTIDSELYYGSKKGTQGALDAGAGNDTDQASLLIALLRVAGIPARYAIGQVWLSGQQAQDLTRTTTTQAAADILSTAGIPATYVQRSAGEPVVAIEHTWAQAWLPYDHYRGVLEAPGASSWVDLTPWVKRFTFSQPVDLRNAVQFNADAYLSTVTTTLPIDLWQNQLRAFIWANNILCATFDQAMRVRTIMPDTRTLLPARLPLRQFATLGTPSAIPDGQRYALSIEVGTEQGQIDFTIAKSLPEIYGQRIDLTFPAASAADQAIIDQHGGLFTTPPYLVNLKPTLSISETVVASGAAVRPGVERVLRVAFTTPGVSSPVPEISAVMEAGEVRVIGLDYQTVPQTLIDLSKARQAALQPAGGASYAAQRLHTMQLEYFHAVDRGWQTVTGIMRHSYVRDLGAGFGVQQVAVRSSFGAPVEVKAGMGLIDMPKLTWTPFDESAGQGSIGPITTLTGYQTSALEHSMIQRTFGMDGISAVKGLQLATDGGQTLVSVTSAGQVAGLQVPQDVKDTLLDALNRGWRGIAPQRSITRYGWTGVGYIIQDPVSGSAAYLISGGANGGEGTGGGAGAGGNCGTGQTSACPSTLETIALIAAAINANNDSGGGGSGGALSRVGASADTAASLSSVGPPISAPSGYRNDVNLSSGNLLLQAGDIVVPGVGIPVGVGRSYNSQSNRIGRFGRGWIDTYGERLELAANSATYIDASGAEYVFAKTGADFTSPPGLFAALTQSGQEYRLTTKEGLVSAFASDGHLLRQTDWNGNTVTLAYDGQQRLTAVSDSSGRTILTFTYADGRLASVTDLANRTVQYAYTPVGDLASGSLVTSIAIGQPPEIGGWADG